MLKLTDDELVAIAVDLSGPWFGGLPTVDVDSEESLAAAALRGHRSLLVRELLNADGELEGDLPALAGRQVGSRDFITVYIGDAEHARASWGIASTHYRASEWILETVTVLGVHSLTVQPTESHRSYFKSLVATALSAGREGLDSEDNFLCLTSVSPFGSGTLSARREELWWTPEDPQTGQRGTASSLSIRDVSGAVDSLMNPKFTGGVTAPENY